MILQHRECKAVFTLQDYYRYNNDRDDKMVLLIGKQQQFVNLGVL